MGIDDQFDGDLNRKSPNVNEKSVGEFVDLGITPLAKQLGLTPEQTNGHWCSRCQGIWFGYTLEAECPACGNRHG